MSDTRKDLIASVIFFLIGAGVLVSAMFIRDPGLSEMGPREFPRFIGVCMVALSSALFIKNVYLSRRNKQAESSMEAKGPEGEAVKKDSAHANAPKEQAAGEENWRKSAGRDELRALGIAGICFFYAITFTAFGYFLSTFLAITLICLLFREKRFWVYPLLYLSALVIWLGFTLFLSIRLP